MDGPALPTLPLHAQLLQRRLHLQQLVSFGEGGGGWAGAGPATLPLHHGVLVLPDPTTAPPPATARHKLALGLQLAVVVIPEADSVKIIIPRNLLDMFGSFYVYSNDSLYEAGAALFHSWVLNLPSILIN